MKCKPHGCIKLDISNVTHLGLKKFHNCNRNSFMDYLYPKMCQQQKWN